MACGLCARFWEEIHARERAFANDYELWCEDTDANRALMERASALREADPAAAFRLYREAAEAGSPLAMETVAWHYRTGTLVAADFETAQDYYRSAIEAGSWMATIGYARLLEDHGYRDRPG